MSYIGLKNSLNSQFVGHFRLESKLTFVGSLSDINAKRQSSVAFTLNFFKNRVSPDS